MSVTAEGIWRSIAGRLYLALGMTLAALIVIGSYTVLYAGHVATVARLAASGSIDGVRAADELDERLDEHRRVVTDAINAPGSIPTAEVVSRLALLEQRMTGGLAASAPRWAPSAELAAELRQDVANLEAMSRNALSAVAAPVQRTNDPLAAEAYLAGVTVMEPAVLRWKTQVREATAADLRTMAKQGVVTEELFTVLTLAGGLVGLLAFLIGRGMLARLKRLTSAMLSLAKGDMATAVPFLAEKDEIGLMAAALAVFRDNARRVKDSEVNMGIALENMVEAILLFSPDDRCVLSNRKAVEMLGLPRAHCGGLSHVEMFQRLSAAQHWPVEATQSVAERVADIWHRHTADMFDVELPDGRSYAISAAVLPNQHLLLSIEDTSERRASAARIFHLAHHDMLTELPNRALFQSRLGAAVEDALSDGNLGVALLLCDLDHFKGVNDTYGHPAGDELLRQAAHRMRETVRKTDVVARLGGDEFAILHLTGAGANEAPSVAERIVAVLSQPFDIHGNRLSIGVSIGIACAPGDASTLTDLTKRADLALYAAKQAGRNQFVVYDAHLGETLEDRRSLAADLRRALDCNGLHVHYQPQVDLQTREIIGFEALARWTHSERGEIPPGTFIPIAEECGLIVRLGEWVLRTACHDAMVWGGETTVAVNVSTQQLREDGFVSTVHAATADTGLPARRLELEITESAMLDDSPRMMAVLNALHALGVRIALDDFGTGYSALSYLEKFPFDKIKIDRSFIRKLTSSGESGMIVRAVAGLGSNLGITTIAEGIEAEEQARLVLEAACQEGQGYLFGRPIPAADIRTLLMKQAILAAE
ncbi:MAG: EAL domain-containing protein [Acetobacteraceae bacterium]